MHQDNGLQQKVTNMIFSNPSGAIHLPCMRILEEVMVKIASDNSIAAFVITTAYKANRPAVEICQMMAEMANDNHDAMGDIISNKLTNELLELFKTHLITFNKSRK